MHLLMNEPLNLTATRVLSLLCIYGDGLPHWSSAERKVLVVQPSSAAAERVFSILSISFTDQQEQSLEDYVEASVMLQYNQH